jgi:hypothetical protein
MATRAFSFLDTPHVEAWHHCDEFGRIAYPAQGSIVRLTCDEWNGQPADYVVEQVLITPHFDTKKNRTDVIAVAILCPVDDLGKAGFGDVVIYNKEVKHEPGSI